MDPKIRKLIASNEVRSAIETEPWAGELVSRIRAETLEWIESYRDDADRVMG